MWTPAASAGTLLLAALTGGLKLVAAVRDDGGHARFSRSRHTAELLLVNPAPPTR
jgi:hypothetical protein